MLFQNVNAIASQNVNAISKLEFMVFRNNFKVIILII